MVPEQPVQQPFIAARYKAARSGASAGNRNRRIDEMANMFSSLFRRSGRRKIYADLLQLDDHLLRDIGLTRTDVHQIMSGRGGKMTRTHE